MPRLTVSYCFEDTDFALRLNESLRTLGFETVASIPFSPINHRLDAMARLGKSTDALIVIVSSAFERDTLDAELESFRIHQKPIIPIIYRGGFRSLGLFQHKPVDFYGRNYKRGLSDLYRVLAALDLQGNVPIETALAAPPTGSPFVRLRDRLTMKVAPVMIGVAALLLYFGLDVARSALLDEAQQRSQEQEREFQTQFPLVLTQIYEATQTAEATYYPTPESTVEPSQ